MAEFSRFKLDQENTENSKNDVNRGQRGTVREETGSSILVQESASFLIVSPCEQGKEKREKSGRKKMIQRMLLRSLTQNKVK